MIVMFCDFAFEVNVESFRACDLVIFGFSEFTPKFLTNEYYTWVERLKDVSSKVKTQFIFTFFVPKKFRTYVGGVRIKNGRILNLFGECFTSRHLSFKAKNRIVSVLFYYDLYAKRGREVSKFSSYIFGIEDDDLLEGTAFLDNKFFNKLTLVGKDGRIECGKGKKNGDKQKMCANIMYKI